MRMESRTISQKNLTSECWMIQFQGTEACKSCEFKNTEECGGQEILKTLKNEKGLDVPID
jgi:hypothetical protein